MAHTTKQIRPFVTILANPFARAALIALAGMGWFGLLLTLGQADLAGWLPGRLALVPIVLLATSLVLLLPGFALVRWLWGDLPLSWPERFGLAAALGCGGAPLLIIATHILRLGWGVWQLITLLGIALAALLIPRPVLPHSTPSTPWWISFSLIGLTIATLIARLTSVRDLVVGANVDSYHHTMIAQLLLDRGGIPANWQPYVPLTTFTYHFGFHANLAFVGWLTGIDLAILLPLVGQIMAALLVPASYTLASRLLKSPLAGLWTAALIGFVNTQPAYYAFWGRYPFVAGLLLLAAIVVLWMHVLEAERLNWRPLLLAAICCAALAHTHYQITILAVLFVGSATLIQLIRANDWRHAGQILLRALLIGLLAGLLAAPWLINTLSGNLDRNVAFNSDRQSGEAFAGVPIPPLTPFYLKGWIILLAVIGLLIAARKRAWRVGLPAIWAILTMLIITPYLFGLPGTGMLEPQVAPLTLFMSVLPLAAYTIASIMNWLIDAPRLARIQPLLHIGVIFILIGISIWGMRWQRDIVPSYIRLVHPADAEAINWIRQSTSTNARFVVNSNPLYGGLMIVGTDAGWWLPLLAGRQTTVPPLTYGSELASDPAYADTTNDLAALLRNAPLADAAPRQVDLTRPEALAALRSAGVTHVYIGANQISGPGTFGDVDRISADRLRASPDFQLLYERNGVLIFALREE
ncbi:MAG: hypothetical protein Fur005_38050 [Roseiflexaceae bacterium]